MPEELTGGNSSRDILIEVRGLVKQLVESKDDHEIRIRLAEESITTMKATSAEAQAANGRTLKIGMVLAALAGAFGNAIMKLLHS